MLKDAAIELTRCILRHGESRIAERLDLSAAEVCRKVNGQTGWTIQQIGEVFAELELRIVGPGQIVIDEDELKALKQLAHKQLTSEVNA